MTIKQKNNLLLICNIRIVGHFTIYSSNMIDWALSRKIKVVYLGYKYKGTYLYKKFKNNKNVIFLEISEVASSRLKEKEFHTDKEIVSYFFSNHNISNQIECINAVQKKYKPDFTLLLNSDDMLLGSDIFITKDRVFERPTYALFTFGYRDYYTGFEDLYNYKLSKLIKIKKVFAAVFTLDEYHTAHYDQNQEYLIFIPDLYREFAKIERKLLSDADQRQLKKLNDFLERDGRPVVPILGKFDDRKNTLWLLEMSRIYPELVYVILGERVPSKHAIYIDTILSELEREDRLFTTFDFVSEHCFELVLTSNRTLFLPLPYEAHYGSSGIQLHAVECGVPILVPDIGLMAVRTVDHNLGLIYKHGDFSDFKDKFDRMLHGTENRGKSLAKFIDCFSKEKIFEAIDYAFKLKTRRPDLPSEKSAASEVIKTGNENTLYFNYLRKGLNANKSGQYQEAIQYFDKALETSPSHKVILLRKAFSLHKLKNGKNKVIFLEEIFKDDPNNAEKIFYLLSLLDNYWRDRSENDSEYVLLATDLLLQTDPDNIGALHLKSAIYREMKRYNDALDILDGLLQQDPVNSQIYLQAKGGIFAACRAYDQSISCFQKALEIAPDFHDLRLNLSDVFRYAENFEQSLAELMKLEAINPAFTGLHFKKGQVYFELKQYDKALEEFRIEVENGYESDIIFDYISRTQNCLFEQPEHTDSQTHPPLGSLAG